MDIKITWKVSDKPTGRYRSFEHRSWPSAAFPDGQYCAIVECADDYTPARAREEHPHAPLVLRIAKFYTSDEGIERWKWVKAKQVFDTMDQVKAAVCMLYNKYPELRPKKYAEARFI